eukprot:comp11315_c0_seq1/m.5717 comp11315_c0_seq1/g.5717  ORF comp11315_c0_seq1/g.5717 comp11315_c0_seq1/m.5717 type:complete len:221 (-) comp11315_c0_seq1:130-792(-)
MEVPYVKPDLPQQEEVKQPEVSPKVEIKQSPETGSKQVSRSSSEISTKKSEGETAKPVEKRTSIEPTSKKQEMKEKDKSAGRRKSGGSVGGGSGADKWSLQILEFKQIRPDDMWWFEKDIVLYTVVSTVPGMGNQTVHRAFSEFQTLFDNILQWYNDNHPHIKAKVPVPPPKHWWWEDHRDAQFLASRRQQLHDWLQNLLKVPYMTDVKPLKDFLDPKVV